MSWQRPNIGSRMNREVHVRFWERAEVKFLRATRQGVAVGRRHPFTRFRIPFRTGRKLKVCLRACFAQALRSADTENVINIPASCWNAPFLNRRKFRPRCEIGEGEPEQYAKPEEPGAGKGDRQRCSLAQNGSDDQRFHRGDGQRQGRVERAEPEISKTDREAEQRQEGEEGPHDGPRRVPAGHAPLRPGR